MHCLFKDKSFCPSLAAYLVQAALRLHYKAVDRGLCTAPGVHDLLASAEAASVLLLLLVWGLLGRLRRLVRHLHVSNMVWVAEGIGLVRPLDPAEAANLQQGWSLLRLLRQLERPAHHGVGSSSTEAGFHKLTDTCCWTVAGRLARAKRAQSSLDACSGLCIQRCASAPHLWQPRVPVGIRRSWPCPVWGSCARLCVGCWGTGVSAQRAHVCTGSCLRAGPAELRIPAAGHTTAGCHSSCWLRIFPRLHPLAASSTGSMHIELSPVPAAAAAAQFCTPAEDTVPMRHWGCKQWVCAPLAGPCALHTPEF